jgi:hypothetical protein
MSLSDEEIRMRCLEIASNKMVLGKHLQWEHIFAQADELCQYVKPGKQPTKRRANKVASEDSGKPDQPGPLE